MCLGSIPKHLSTKTLKTNLFIFKSALLVIKLAI